MKETKSLFTSKEHYNKPSEHGLSLVPDNVIRQELVTYIQTDDGLKRSTCIRKYRQSTHDEEVIEEVIVINNN
jgi:KaiC/GvpD/RAD55 family RecA-like ATPase